ncbi:MAG: BatD family protein [Candidatus Endonucleobacter bathymodioli]|uniref:BatD family protein n=1 Tax=Candidatus Endonucleibacter bathymodioli TaxID=539814 RepID=A0AA90SD86_9GAMM|nr:BatD family protein [Candidatus Endonucleobacter bathymodioli]
MTNAIKVTSWIFVTLLCVIIMHAPPALSAFSASVDRTNIAVHETLELTLRSDANSASSPNLNVLEQDFFIVGTRQSRQIRIINNHQESWRDWVVTISPKHQGRLTIPAITLGNEVSSAITINVQDGRGSEQGSGTGISPIFMRAEISDESVYIQQHIKLTLKIFHSIRLHGESSLSSMDIEDAIVNKIGDTATYETTLNGIRYSVFEINYVISPQKSGTLTIPSQTFTGTTPTRGDPFASIFSMGGRSVSARSPEIQVTVKDSPQDYSGHNWLPARNLILSESWSQPIDSIKVGDAITRTITMDAEGLFSAQLPILKIPSPVGVNTYPDQSSTNDYESADGFFVGKRVSAIAMVPTEAGTIELPAVRVSWFDITNHEARVAEIPATTLILQPAEDSHEVISSTKSVVANKETAKEDSLEKSLEAMDGTSLSIWQWVAIILAGLWLLTGLVILIFWKKSRNKSSQQDQDSSEVDEDTPEISLDLPNEASAFKALQNACANGAKSEMILEQMKLWCRVFLNDASIRTVDQCTERLKSDQLKALCAELDSSIYSDQSCQATGEEILEVCSSLRKTFFVDTKSNIDELYPE